MGFLRRILFGCSLFWYGVTKHETFAQTTFVTLTKLLEMLLKTCIDNRSYIAHCAMGDKRVVSVWTYPGLSKNPTDRITELTEEIEALKEMLNEIKPKEGAV